MSNILEEAEAALAEVEASYKQGWPVDSELLARLVPDLVDALKEAQEENERIHRLAEKWDSAVELTSGNPSIVTRSFAAELKKCFSAEVAE